MSPVAARPTLRLLGVAALLAGCRIELGLGLQSLSLDAGAPSDVAIDRPGVATALADAGPDVVAPDDGGDDAPAPCAEGWLRCDGRCVDPSTDPAHCRLCGRACRTGVCVDGDCGEAIRDVAIGDLHLCAARVDGRVYCWGYNRFGQLGDGTTRSREHPWPVPDVAGAEAVHTGPDHTCARNHAGALWCWGANDHYQLGTRMRDANPHPHAELVVGVGPVATVGIGIAHTCVGTLAGTALCWGDGAEGQLGTGPRGGPAADGRYDDDPEPSLVLDPNPIDSVTAGHQHSCALEQDGSAWCWGASDYLGVADRIENRPSPVLVEGPGGFTQIAAGSAHTCALRGTDGTVWCWGSNAYGQLGIGRARPESRVPVRVPGLVGVVQVAVAPGGGHTCAFDGLNQVFCWGANDHGQLGDGTTTPSDAPLQVSIPMDQVRAIRAGEDITCAVTAAGAELWCWGDNLGGNLSVGAPASQVDVTTPARVVWPP